MLSNFLTLCSLHKKSGRHSRRRSEILLSSRGWHTASGGRDNRQTNRTGLRQCHFAAFLPSRPRLGIGGVRLRSDTYNRWLTVSSGGDALNLRKMSEVDRITQN